MRKVGGLGVQFYESVVGATEELITRRCEGEIGYPFGVSIEGSQKLLIPIDIEDLNLSIVTTG